MEKTEQALEKAAKTLEKYKKNKIFVSPEELDSKYKIPFQKLKQQLKEELEEYLRLFVLNGLQIIDDNKGWQVVAEINQEFQDARIGRRIGQAAFQEFDLDKIKQVAQEHRQKVQEIYKAYKEGSEQIE